MATISPTEYEARIKALERLNATLAAQVDRMRPIVDAALALIKPLRQTPAWSDAETALEYAARIYQQQMAELAKER